MNIRKSLVLVGTLFVLGACSMVDSVVDDDVLPNTRAYFYGLHNAIVEESGDAYIVVSRNNRWHSGIDFPELVQDHCEQSGAKPFWEDMWLENDRQYARYSCR